MWAPAGRRWFPGVLAGLIAAAFGAAYGIWAYANRPERDDSLRTFSAGSSLLAVAFAPDGRTIAAGAWDGSVTIWDVSSGRRIHRLVGHSDRIHTVAFSPDGRLIASGSRDHTARIWSTESGATLHVITSHRDRVLAIAFSPDGRWLITGSRDHTAKIWSTGDYRELKTTNPDGGFISSVAIAPDSRRAAFGDWFGRVETWGADGTSDPTVVATLDTVHGAFAFSTDLRAFAAGSRNPANPFDRSLGSIRIYDAATGQVRQSFRGHAGGPNALAFSPDGQRLASGGADNAVMVWDLVRASEARRLLGHARPISDVAFSPDGTLLASAGDDGDVKLWALAR
jgi:WD40 repeat protein